MSFVSYAPDPLDTRLVGESHTRLAPVVFVVNGGPSTPASMNMGANLTGLFAVEHSHSTGHIDLDEDGSSYALLNGSGSAARAHVVHIDPVGTGLSKQFGAANKWHYGVQRDADITAALIKWYLEDPASLQMD